MGLAPTWVLAAWIVAWAAEPSVRNLPPAPAAPSDAARAGETGTGEGSDVLLVVFSGRCAICSCTPPDENLDTLAQRLVPSVVAAWSAAGLEVEVWTYRSHVDGHLERGRGYASATEDHRKAVQDGILRPGNATRAVLLGYSHGTQFAHLRAFEHPQVPIAASVLLDSICLGWDADHAARLVEALAPAGLEIVRQPGMHHQESDEPQGPSFDAWTGWVLGVLNEC